MYFCWYPTGGLQDFSVSPRPLGTNWSVGTYWDFIRVEGFGTKGLDPGLDNKSL